MQPGDDRNIFLLTLPATSRDRKAALVVVGLSALLFAVTLPYLRVQLPPVPAFVAGYQSALAINDLITTILLLSQFAFLRKRALLLLASGYLFAALAAVALGLTFPNVVTADGLLNAGPQTAAWIFMAWRGVFPSFVIGYALLKSKDGGPEVKGSVTRSIFWSAVTIFAAMAAVVFVATEKHDLLPAIIIDNGYAPSLWYTSLAVGCINLAALAVLWLRRPHSVLDVWLHVVLCAWLFDLASSTILNAERYDFGFYVGRVYGLCAACFVLGVLLFQNFSLQARLSRLLYASRQQAGERDRLYSAVVQSSNDAIITKTLDGTITSWNSAAERLFGYTAAEVIGRNIDIIVPFELLSELRGILARINQGETIAHHETSRVTKDGRILQVSLSISPLRSSSGEIVGASKIARDLTESRRAQIALNQETEERQRIFETSQDLILITDTRGTFVQVSPSSMMILGYAPQEMIGHSAAEFIHPDDLDSTRREMRMARNGELMRNFETRYIHKDGRTVSLIWMGVWSEPVRRHFFVDRDVTEKLVTEAQFRHAQKMDAIGQLTAAWPTISTTS